MAPADIARKRSAQRDVPKGEFPQIERLIVHFTQKCTLLCFDVNGTLTNSRAAERMSNISRGARVIENPILRGFNADPSIVRVGQDYYIATSTFAWFPGVALYHSRDLAHWTPLGGALTRTTQVDLRGDADSCGIWAPCIRYNESEKLFYLVYTDVKNTHSRFFDLRNLLVTSVDVSGPWSDPLFLNASGFDPSLFIDDDGKMYIANLEWDFRAGYEHPGAIVLQEFSRDTQTLSGEVHRIYRGGSDLGCLEGPNIYKREGRYYLVTAEGGTGYGHSVVVARANSIWGPYEPDPENPVLTSLRGLFYGRNNDDFLKPYLYNPDVEIQKPGHAAIVDTPQGDWYMVHLGARPLPSIRACVLGRETFIQKCDWTADGWLRVDSPERRPKMRITEPGVSSGNPRLDAIAPEAGELRDDFDGPTLPAWYSTLRVPADESWMSLHERKGWLRLSGRQSLHSLHEQSLAARRVEHFRFAAETLVEFNPKTFQQMAGLVIMQGTETWYYLRIYYSESLRSPAVSIMTSDRFVIEELKEFREPLKSPCCRLGADVHDQLIQFRFSPDGESWKTIGSPLDRTRISDEHARSFAGAFVGICCQDLGGTLAPAYFDYFAYTPGIE